MYGNRRQNAIKQEKEAKHSVAGANRKRIGSYGKDGGYACTEVDAFTYSSHDIMWGAQEEKRCDI